MHSDLNLYSFKDFVCHGKILVELATLLDEIEVRRPSKNYKVIGFEGAIPLKNYHQMIRTLQNECRVPLARETIPEDLDLFSIFNVDTSSLSQRFSAQSDAACSLENKIFAYRCFVAGISRQYNNILMGIQGNLSLVLLALGDRHPFLSIIKGAEELVQSGSFAISLLLGYLAERREQTRRIRFTYLVAEVAATQSYIPAEKDRQNFEQWIQDIPKLEGLVYLAEKCSRSFDGLLRSITTWAEWIRLSGEVDAKISERLLKIKNLAETGHRISGKLLAFAGKENFVLQRVTSLDLVSTCLEEFKQTYPGVSLRVYQQNPGAYLLVDPKRLNQALLEVMRNAVEHMCDGGRITLSVKKLTLAQRRSKWATLPAGSYIMITIKDTGFSPEKRLETRIKRRDVERVFDPFFTTKSPGKGIGLGLSMVYGTVRQLGGAATIGFGSDCEFGKGTQVKLLLPRID